MENKLVPTFQFKKEIEELSEPMIYVPEGKTHIRLEGTGWPKSKVAYSNGYESYVGR